MQINTKVDGRRRSSSVRSPSKGLGPSAFQLFPTPPIAALFLQSNFRAVSEQFQADFRIISEQFQSNFRAISEQFQSNFRAILDKLKLIYR